MDIQELRKLLNSLGIYRYNQIGNNLQINCPFFYLHEGRTDNHKSMGISSEKEIYHCFACKSKGQLADFIKRVKKIDWFNSVQILYDYGGGEVDHKPKPELKSVGTFPESWLAPFSINYEKWNAWRGITKESAEYWEIGYDRSEKRVIFPIWNESGGLVGCVGRMLSNGQPKWYFYWELSKSLVVYGLNRLQNSDYLIIVEGCLDVVLGIQNEVKNLVGIQGSSISDEQIRILLSSTDTVVLALDNDSSGSLGTRDAVRKLRDRCKLFYVQYPKEVKDIGEMKEDFKIFNRENWQIV